MALDLIYDRLPFSRHHRPGLFCLISLWAHACLYCRSTHLHAVILPINIFKNKCFTTFAWMTKQPNSRRIFSPTYKRDKRKTATGAMKQCYSLTFFPIHIVRTNSNQPLPPQNFYHKLYVKHTLWTNLKEARTPGIFQCISFGSRLRAKMRSSIQ